MAENNETTEIAPVKQQMNIGQFGLQITTLTELGRFAQAVARSPFAPRDFKDADAIMVAIQMGMEVGLKPMQSLQGIAVVNGRPTIWGDTAKALALGSGLCEDFREFFEGDSGNKKDLTAVCEIKRKGLVSVIRATFSVADAERAGLLNKQGPWSQYPRRMLQMRARSYAIRDAFPDVLKGLNTSEEVGDYQPEDNVRPLASGTSSNLNKSAVPVSARPATESMKPRNVTPVDNEAEAEPATPAHTNGTPAAPADQQEIEL